MHNVLLLRDGEGPFSQCNKVLLQGLTDIFLGFLDGLTVREASGKGWTICKITLTFLFFLYDYFKIEEFHSRLLFGRTAIAVIIPHASNKVFQVLSLASSQPGRVQIELPCTQPAPLKKSLGVLVKRPALKEDLVEQQWGGVASEDHQIHRMGMEDGFEVINELEPGWGSVPSEGGGQVQVTGCVPRPACLRPKKNEEFDACGWQRPTRAAGSWFMVMGKGGAVSESDSLLTKVSASARLSYGRVRFPIHCQMP